MMLREQLLKEMYESVDKVNRIMLNDEISSLAKRRMIKEEKLKQIRLRKFFEEWGN
jgi:hypothetical protein